MHPHAALIERFYTAFQAKDAEAMARCYAPDARFSDPVFTDLQGPLPGDMWRMGGRACQITKPAGYSRGFRGGVIAPA